MTDASHSCLSIATQPIYWLKTTIDSLSLTVSMVRNSQGPGLSSSGLESLVQLQWNEGSPSSLSGTQAHLTPNRSLLPLGYGQKAYRWFPKCSMARSFQAHLMLPCTLLVDHLHWSSVSQTTCQLPQDLAHVIPAAGNSLPL